MPASATLTAPIVEIFSSIQGEGLYVGQLQTFLRLRGCPLRCRWCDTPQSLTLPPTSTARIASRTRPRREPTPLTPFQVACAIAECEPAVPRPISLTGGEPLLHADFILALAPFTSTRRLHLETAGAHPHALARVLPVLSHVSLDLKLPADLAPPVELPTHTPEPAPTTAAEWAEVRAACLHLLREHTSTRAPTADACAKIIVAGNRTPEVFDELLESVAEHHPTLPVILQPVTPIADVPAPDIELVTAVAERARSLELDVRVIPQVHRFLKVP